MRQIYSRQNDLTINFFTIFRFFFLLHFCGWLSFFFLLSFVCHKDPGIIFVLTFKFLTIIITFIFIWIFMISNGVFIALYNLFNYTEKERKRTNQQKKKTITNWFKFEIKRFIAYLAWWFSISILSSLVLHKKKP